MALGTDSKFLIHGEIVRSSHWLEHHNHLLLLERSKLLLLERSKTS